MRWLWLVLLTLALALVSGCQAPQSQQVRVLTYNIHHGEGIDGKLDLPRIAQVIQEANPDVVALQEVDQVTERTGKVDQAAELGRLTGMQAVYGKAMDYQGGGYGLAVLSRWPIVQDETIPLEAPGAREPRILLLTRIQPEGKGPAFWLGSTHLDHTGEETYRLQQIQTLESAAGGKGTDPIIVAGDFNAVPESQVMTQIFQSWTDAAALDPLPTVPTRNPRRRIDYILYRPANRWKVVETQVLPEEVASDHRAVLAVLEWAR